uniref:Uncharacterized protein n=1 Tax=Ditylenchus dipsaci TaxID=166011 RepID=A0A915EVQ5_9BILA
MHCLPMFCAWHNFNSLLIWLIKTRTVKEMKIYGQILLQTCANNICMLILAAVVQPVRNIFFLISGKQECLDVLSI